VLAAPAPSASPHVMVCSQHSAATQPLAIAQVAVPLAAVPS